MTTVIPVDSNPQKNSVKQKTPIKANKNLSKKNQVNASNKKNKKNIKPYDINQVTSTFDKQKLNNKANLKTNVFDSYASLQKLRDSIAIKGVETGLNEYIALEQKKKNMIPKSSSTYMSDDAVSEIKLKDKYVDCNNSVLKGLSIFAGALGGRIKCTSARKFKLNLKKNLILKK